MAQRVALLDTEAAIKCIERDGAVILTAFSSKENVERVNTDAKSYIDAIVQERASRSLPRETTRCTRLFGRSTTARETWLQQPAFLNILNHFIRTEFLIHNDEEDPSKNVVLKTDAILSAAATLDIGPGMPAQGLHRDDFIWQQTHTAASGNVYERGRDVAMGLLVPGVSTSKENGATRFIPGSHLWEQTRQPKTEVVESAEMDVGEAFLFLGSTLHGGGENQTDKSRPMHGFFFCRSWMRPEENQHLWWTEKEVRQWSPAAQKQAGYILDNPYLGHCNEGNPVDLFRASNASIDEVKA